MSATLKLVHDTRFKKQSGKYPVKLCVTFRRKPHPYQTVYELSIEEWEKLDSPRVSNYLQEVRKKFGQIETDSRNVTSKIDPFSFEEFEKEYILNNPLFKQRKRKKTFTHDVKDEFDFSPYTKKFPILEERNIEAGTIGATYLKIIKRLIQEERMPNALSYKWSYQSLKAYKGNVYFKEVTPSYLRQYELSMIKNNNSKTTAGMYLRALRAVFNEAIHDCVIKRDYYPFGRRKYIIPAGKNNKRALNLERIEQIYYYQPRCEQERKARDFWLLFYLGNGVNPKDVALFKYKDIQDGYIRFERSKTERTSGSDQKTISVCITEDIETIIDRWGNKDKNPANYIFPVLSPGIDQIQQYDLINYFTKFVNKWMRKICKELGFDREATTMVARHSFATILKNSGATTEFIKESLGHANIKTTENYLGSFPDATKKENAAKLTAFKVAPAFKTA